MTNDRPSSESKDIKDNYLKELLHVGHALKKAIDLNDLEKQKILSQSRSMLLMLLEYLIVNLDAPSVDRQLIPIIENFLGLKREKENDKDEELEEEEKEEELSKEEKQRRLRLAIYEIYKILNPNRLAGETQMQNFINNVKTRGLEVALKNDGKEYVKNFKLEDLKNLESYKTSFVASLAKEGHHGFGRGT